MVKILKYMTKFIVKNRYPSLSHSYIPDLYTFLLIFISMFLKTLPILLHTGFSILRCAVYSHFSHVQLFGTPWTVAHQASLSFTISLSLLKLMSIESVMPSNHLLLCYPLLLLPSLFSSIRVFSDELTLRIR